MKTKVLYWLISILFCAFIMLGAVPDVLQIPEARGFMTHLGYPLYLLPFLGVAKILGVIAVLFPAFRGLKEWAYAGITFDLVGAFYSHLSVSDPASVWTFPLIGLVLLAASYLLYRRTVAGARLDAKGTDRPIGSCRTELRLSA